MKDRERVPQDGQFHRDRSPEWHQIKWECVPPLNKWFYSVIGSDLPEFHTFWYTGSRFQILFWSMRSLWFAQFVSFSEFLFESFIHGSFWHEIIGKCINSGGCLAHPCTLDGYVPPNANRTVWQMDGDLTEGFSSWVSMEHPSCKIYKIKDNFSLNILFLLRSS